MHNYATILQHFQKGAAALAARLFSADSTDARALQQPSAPCSAAGPPVIHEPGDYAGLPHALVPQEHQLVLQTHKRLNSVTQYDGSARLPWSVAAAALPAVAAPPFYRHPVLGAANCVV